MYSITARALLEKLSESDPSALKAISALFIGPLVPGGKHTWFFLLTDVIFTLYEPLLLALAVACHSLCTDTLGISIWELGPGPSGSTEIAFEARNSKGSLCLGEGRAYLIKKTVLPETRPPTLVTPPVRLGP